MQDISTIYLDRDWTYEEDGSSLASLRHWLHALEDENQFVKGFKQNDLIQLREGIFKLNYRLYLEKASQPNR